MKYISIDIETTGLAEDAQILEIGAIVEDTNIPFKFKDIPKFECIIDHSKISGEAVALHMNARIIQILSEYHQIKDASQKATFKEKHKIYTEIEASEALHEFVWEHYVNNGQEYVSPFKKRLKNQNPTPPVRVICAGKNFGTFDRPKLMRLNGMGACVRFNHRILDPAILFTDWENDEKPPTLTECKQRAGIEGKVTHKAIEDAWDVVLLMRKKY